MTLSRGEQEAGVNSFLIRHTQILRLWTESKNYTLQLPTYTLPATSKWSKARRVRPLAISAGTCQNSWRVSEVSEIQDEVETSQNSVREFTSVELEICISELNGELFSTQNVGESYSFGKEIKYSYYRHDPVHLEHLFKPVRCSGGKILRKNSTSLIILMV